MPNWCMNELSVSGEAKELKKFVMDSQGLPAKYPPVYKADGTILFASPEYTEPYFCFNALLPTPQEVLAVGFDGHDKIPELNRKYAYMDRPYIPLMATIGTSPTGGQSGMFTAIRLHRRTWDGMKGQRKSVLTLIPHGHRRRHGWKLSQKNIQHCISSFITKNRDAFLPGIYMERTAFAGRIRMTTIGA